MRGRGVRRRGGKGVRRGAHLSVREVQQFSAQMLQRAIFSVPLVDRDVLQFSLSIATKRRSVEELGQTDEGEGRRGAYLDEQQILHRRGQLEGDVVFLPFQRTVRGEHRLHLHLEVGQLQLLRGAQRFFLGEFVDQSLDHVPFAARL